MYPIVYRNFRVFTSSAAKNASRPSRKGSVRARPSPSSGDASAGVSTNGRGGGGTRGGGQERGDDPRFPPARSSRSSRSGVRRAGPARPGRASSALGLGQRRRSASAPPADVGVAPDRAEAGAGGVDQDGVEDAGRAAPARVGLDDLDAASGRPDRTRQQLQPAAADVGRDDRPLSPIAAAICVVLPPGDAQASRMPRRRGGRRTRRRAATLRPGRRTRRCARAASAADCPPRTIRPCGAKPRRLGLDAGVSRARPPARPSSSAGCSPEG